MLGDVVRWVEGGPVVGDGGEFCFVTTTLFITKILVLLAVVSSPTPSVGGRRIILQTSAGSVAVSSVVGGLSNGGVSSASRRLPLHRGISRRCSSMCISSPRGVTGMRRLVHTGRMNVSSNVRSVRHRHSKGKATSEIARGVSIHSRRMEAAIPLARDSASGRRRTSNVRGSAVRPGSLVPRGPSPFGDVSLIRSGRGGMVGTCICSRRAMRRKGALRLHLNRRTIDSGNVLVPGGSPIFNRIAEISNGHIVIGVSGVGCRSGVLPFGGIICSGSTLPKVCIPSGPGTRIAGSILKNTLSNLPDGIPNLRTTSEITKIITAATTTTKGRTVSGGMEGMQMAVGAGCRVFLEPRRGWGRTVGEVMVSLVAVLVISNLESRAVRRVHSSSFSISTCGAFRLVFAGRMGCFSVNSRGITNRGVRTCPGTVHLGSAIPAFRKVAGVDIIATSKRCCDCGVSFAGSLLRDCLVMKGRCREPPEVSIDSDRRARLVFPRGVVCISCKAASIRIMGTSKMSGVMTMHTTKGFARSAGVDIIATSRGFCAFSLSCSSRPDRMSFIMSPNTGTTDQEMTLLSGGRLGDIRHRGLEGRVGSHVRSLPGLCGSCTKVHFAVAGVFVSGSVLFFGFHLAGCDGVSCMPSFIHFCVRSTGGHGGATVRRVSRGPLFFFSLPREVPTRSDGAFAMTLGGFAVPSGGILVVRMRRLKKKHRFGCGLGGTPVVDTRVLGPKAHRGEMMPGRVFC